MTLKKKIGEGKSSLDPLTLPKTYDSLLFL